MASDLPFSLTPLPHPEGCDGHGWVTSPAPAGRTVSAHCGACTHNRALSALMRFVPPRFTADIDIPDPVAEWIHRGRDAEGLYLTGRVGSGKTHLAYAATAHWCLGTGVTPRDAGHLPAWEGGDRYGPTVVFVRATALFDELRPGNDGTRQRIVDCQRAALLVIDDLGAEKPSEWTAEKLYEVVDERYARARPVIITSNVPPAKLAKHVGDRVASRFAEMCTVVPVLGDDRRRAQ